MFFFDLTTEADTNKWDNVKLKKKKKCYAGQRKWNWKWKSLSCVRLFATPWSIYSLGNSSGQNSGVGSPSLLQGIFPTQESNPGLPHCRQILYQLSHQGSPRILEWVAIAFPGDLPNPGIRLRSPALQTDALPAEPQKTTIKTGNLVQRGKKMWSANYMSDKGLIFKEYINKLLVGGKKSYLTMGREFEYMCFLKRT